jgi:hypothetical protein
MGYIVKLSVIFECGAPESLHPLAQACLPAVREQDVKAAEWYLQDLLERKNDMPGTKSGMSTWGRSGKYASGDSFVKALAPFWFMVINPEYSSAGEFTRIMVFAQGEDDRYATAYEIFRENPDDETSLTVKKHLCPFSWVFPD